MSATESGKLVNWRTFWRSYRYWRHEHPALWRREALKLAWRTARGRSA